MPAASSVPAAATPHHPCVAGASLRALTLDAQPKLQERLRRYQRAVQRQMEKGAPQPMRLSEYLEAVKAKRAGQPSHPAPL